MKKIPQPEDPGRASEAAGENAGAQAGETGEDAGEDAGEEAGRATRSGQAARAARQSGGRGKRKPSRSQARRFARERALQALYQWDMSDAESSTVKREFMERQDMSRVDVDYFERLFKGVTHDVDAVDTALAEGLDRPLAEVDPIERALLRIAAYELAHVLETPARVIINEGVEITKRFGADNGHRYVNGVLDRVASQLRPIEMQR